MEVLLSGLLGFLSWNLYLSSVLLVAFPCLVYWLTWRGKSKRLTGRIFAGSLITGLSLALVMPHLNAVYLRAAGTQRLATIEAVTPFSSIILTRNGVLDHNVRYDLRVVEDDGSEWTAAIHRDAGLVGPSVLVDFRVSRGDRVTIAYVEGLRSNVIVIDEASDAVWMARARGLDAGWEISPSGDNWVMHKVHRDNIEEFLEDYGHTADARTIAHLTERLGLLTEMPPAGLSPDLIPGR
ncbi:MAG: hypothetical protein P0Y65_14710 [Candidatus Devosia phytovorans]|uniref:Transmembrane protein n=1 Tax=Candidatus Devosia phytovorans TaxID=3121372 RepID=A0AAJ5VU76_9HYPH|nr:hypothetical protein [Devosia sp.]WEK03439.1 MAG: hypothetical protein P0Y65_14710 [Devosia sp.]